MINELEPLAKELLGKGFTPHTKTQAHEDGERNELWWEKSSPSLPWSAAFTLIAFLTFVLIMVKGWPA